MVYATIKERDGVGGNDDHSSFHLPGPDVASELTWQEFPEGVSWTPEKMEVNGRKGRRAICVLAQDRFHYRVYDLDSPLGGDGVRETETEGSDELMF